MFRLVVYFVNGKFVSDLFGDEEEAREYARQYIEAFETSGMNPNGYQIKEVKKRKKRTTKTTKK